MAEKTEKTKKEEPKNRGSSGFFEWLRKQPPTKPPGVGVIVTTNFGPEKNDQQ